MRHRRHDEIDNLFRKSVASAEFRIPTINMDEKKIWQIYSRKHPNSTWFTWKEQLDRKLFHTDNASWPSLLQKNASRSFRDTPFTVPWYLHACSVLLIDPNLTAVESKLLAEDFCFRALWGPHFAKLFSWFDIIQKPAKFLWFDLFREAIWLREYYLMLFDCLSICKRFSVYTMVLWVSDITDIPPPNSPRATLQFLLPRHANHSSLFLSRAGSLGGI